MVTNLRHESIWHRQAEYTCHEGRAAEEEEVPVETSWFLQGELFGLGGDTADVLQRVSRFNTRVSRDEGGLTWS